MYMEYLYTKCADIALTWYTGCHHSCITQHGVQY